MKSLAPLLILASLCDVACTSPAQSDGKEWLSTSNSPFRGVDIDRLQSQHQWQEVSDDQRALAIMALSEVSFVEITDARLSTMVGDSLQCKRGRRPWLVRAVYGHRYTGDYRVTHLDDKLEVVHMSLGDNWEAHKSALLACLDFAPVALLVRLTITE